MLMEQSVCMSWPDARPIAHLLLNSSFTARATVVPRPSNKAPAKADVMFLRIGFVLGSDWGFPLIYSTRRPGHGVGLRDRSSDRRHLVSFRATLPIKPSGRHRRFLRRQVSQFDSGGLREEALFFCPFRGASCGT